MALDNAREICTQIYNDYRENASFDHVKLMMIAFEAGQVRAFAKAKEIAAATVTQPAHPSTVMDIADELYELTGAYDREYRPAKSYASEVADPVADDRRALARASR
jgi:hypothetical protein